MFMEAVSSKEQCLRGGFGHENTGETIKTTTAKSFNSFGLFQSNLR